jgi:nucleoside-diphosphate-sugar epimerase
LRILVTGAAGLYGIHTVDMLVKRNDVSKVIGVDNFSREFLVADPFSLVASGRLKRKSEVLRMDFRDLSPTLIDRMDVDVVIHYAACVSIPESARAPLKYFRVNELGTFRFLHTLLKTKKHPFLIYASSPEVYGNRVYAAKASISGTGIRWRS